jgi:hypothetical protein
VIVAVALAGSVAYAWKALGEASALTTSYSAVVEHRGSLMMDAYELVSGILFFRRATERLVAGKVTHRERLGALMHWAHENVRPQFAGPRRVVADNAIDIVRRGHGYCDQAAHVFATLAHFAGYEAHLLFLRAPDGTSPHTVAEVRADDRWVLVDPWLGTLFLDRGGRLTGIGDLRTTAALPEGYALLGAGIDEGHFRRATRFETFPYQHFSGVLSRVWRKLAGLARIDMRDRSRRATTAAKPEAPRGGLLPAAVPAATDVPGTPDLRAQILRMEDARWAHLEGRYHEAIVEYRRLLTQRLPSDMVDSVRFFLGLALLRAAAADHAIAAFDAALEASPETQWAPSIRYYRAEARLQTGDIAGAVADLRAAKIPSAAQKLASLARNESFR